MKKLLFLGAMLLMLFTACRKDVNEQFETETPYEPPITVIEDYNPQVINVNASLIGFVLTEAGEPVSNVEVNLGNLTQTTDADGVFFFEDVTMNKAGTFVQVEVDGYFPGSTRFFPEEGSNNYATIKLLEKTNIGQFDALSGGEVSSSSGIKLDFPTNAVIDMANGDAYEGMVQVAARWLDPTADDLGDIMPGALQGVNESAEEVALASYGMMAVSLTGAGGEALNLGNDKKAELTFPVPAELQGNAPSEIPLWSFNEEYGIWVEEGTAALVGDNYVGEVSHFSFWNCDAPFPLINVNGTINYTNGDPAANIGVRIIRSNTNAGWGWTDGDGNFAGKIPSNEDLTLEVFTYDACGNLVVLYTEEIGPFSNDVTLPTITVDPLNSTLTSYEITGTLVDCDGDPVSSGFVKITYDNGYYGTQILYVEDGEAFNFVIYDCDNDITSFDLVATDLVNLEESAPQTFNTAPTVDVGAISACGNVVTEFFNLTLDGELFNGFNLSAITFNTDSSFIQSSFPGVGTGGALGTVFIEGFPMTPGTYTGDDVNYFYVWGIDAAFSPDDVGVTFTCGAFSQGDDCNWSEFILTEVGSMPGENVSGSFTGVGDFTGANGEIYPNISYSGTFSIEID